MRAKRVSAPVALLDLDLHQLPSTIAMEERYGWALALIRLRGHPVGKAMLPVLNGQIDGTELRDTLAEAAGWPLWERWLQDYLEWDPVSTGNAVPPKATVAICTRDRPEDLRWLVHHEEIVTAEIHDW